VKVILIGEYGVGKSSIFRRFATNTFTTDSSKRSTLGLDFYAKPFQENNVKIQLWDTGGMERVASVTSSYYKHSEAALLVFALDNSDSFHALSQHLLEVVTYAETARIFLCGNKSDLQPQVTDQDIEAFCEETSDCIAGYFKTSCKTGEGLEEMFTTIASSLSTHVKSRHDLLHLDETSFQVTQPPEESSLQDDCLC
jgi:small GTP-binding protein